MARYGIGTRPGTCLLTSLYQSGGIDIDLIKMSPKTLNRKTHTIVEFLGKIIRDENLDKIRNLKLVLHFETKMLRQVHHRERHFYK
jgi:ethanolamine utilization cobalamin adenosyltransferase